ncbi:NAD-dependent epimerase/dehydratase family protein [Sphingobacterium faecale]|uniref:NAD-dependent epimerase/dehydratase family protein n=1 Tax=Sphingobacterium faecale TaxID=2803775 RepID=A0ABS1QYK7_9SPHI|nr:NAD-dependent epimerase/dehydratase family protein [Sphingobacterium faecale]MBL1407265.1 NAD-dependent epimerase/dehydratase family protein [Sphingobacterium faecale]
MKIAIIGGSGFIGTNLIRLLVQNQDYELLNLDKSQSTDFSYITRIVDVLDEDGLTKTLNSVDLVVLLAAEHQDNVHPISLYYEVNVQGMRNVLSAMEKNEVKRLVFTSSVAVYGLDKDNPDESFSADPFNHYGRSKWEAELVLQEWYANHQDWNINIIRPTVVFGEGNRGNVFNLLNQIASNRFMMIGKGQNQKSMSYVGNVAAFISFLFQNNKCGYGVYNYVDKPDLTTHAIVYNTGRVLDKPISSLRIPYWIGMAGGYAFDILAFLTRRKFAISSVRVRKFCATTKYDATKVQRSGFEAPFTMEEGLERTLVAEFGTNQL